MTGQMRFHEDTVRLITLAVNRAITERVPLHHQENNFETNNHRWLLRGDMINQCLREVLIVEGISLHPFRRRGWQGRLIIDQKRHVSYSVVSEGSLDRVMAQRKRNWPHYLQSVLFEENGEYDGLCEQESMFDYEDAFSPDTYEQDFKMIMDGMIDNPDEWHHYIIRYRAVGNELKEIKMLFLNKQFNEVTESVDLMEYAKPDYSALTATIKKRNEDKTASAEKAKSLVGLKPGIKPELYSEEDEA